MVKRLKPWGEILVGRCGFCGEVRDDLTLTQMCGWPEGTPGRPAFICLKCEAIEDAMDLELEMAGDDDEADEA